ncbi:MAG: hypothetical protein E7105_04405 [Prevotella sp.]|nr:hypothetical protein [Prevotella sp.]
MSTLLATVLLFPGRAAVTSLPIRALSPNGRLAPDLDKITVTPTRQTQKIIDGFMRNSIIESNNERALRLENGHIVCMTSDSGVLTLFDAGGHTIRTIPVRAGETRIKTEERGLVIASLNVNARAFARKFVIN